MKYVAIIMLAICCGGPVGKKSGDNIVLDELLFWCENKKGPWGIFDSRVKAQLNCLKPTLGKFDNYPIRLHTIPELAQDVRDVVDKFNFDVGFELFKYINKASLPTDFDVAVLVEPRESGIVGQAFRMNMGGRKVGLVMLYRAEMNTSVVYHELGHIVGLRHDTSDKGSIMYPSVAFVLPQLRAVDRSNLRILHR